MITIKKLKELIKDLPDEAICWAYDGEITGIGIQKDDKRWFIEAEDIFPKENTYTEGFDNDNK